MSVIKKSAVVILVVVSAFMLAACGNATPATPTIDPNQIMTQIAETVAAQINATASAQPTATQTVTPTTTTTTTPTPTATSLTPQPTSTRISSGPVTTDANGLNSLYVSDTVPDNTRYDAGTEFTEVWTIQNNGTTTWTSDYTLMYLDSQPIGFPLAATLVIPVTTPIAPGESGTFTVVMTAPDNDNTYTSYWRMVSPSGVAFGQWMWVKIIIGAAPTGTVVSTATTNP